MDEDTNLRIQEDPTYGSPPKDDFDMRRIGWAIAAIVFIAAGIASLLFYAALYFHS